MSDITWQERFKMFPINRRLAIVVFVVVALIVISAIISSIIFGGSSPQVSQENVQIMPVPGGEDPVVVTPTPTPTAAPTRKCVNVSETVQECTYIERIHIVDNADPVATIENEETPIEATGSVDWKSAQRTLLKEKLGLWLGRNNPFWKESGREQVYQSISSYVREYRHGVKIESAQFDRFIISQGPRIYIMKDLFVGGEYMEAKVTAYSSTFINPNDEDEEVEVIFFYDKEDDLIACGYGDHKAIITKRNFVLGGNADTGNGGGDTTGTNTDTDNTDVDVGSPEGGVPS